MRRYGVASLLSACTLAPAGLSTSLVLETIIDPSTSSQYEACDGNEEFGGVDAIVRYPSEDVSCATMLHRKHGLPFVVLLHGKNYGYDTYDYLLEHLASNGVIAMSFDIIAEDNNVEEHQNEGADLVISVMDSVNASWVHRSAINPSKVGLIGHSRGGRTVLVVAKKNLQGTPWTVRAIVGLGTNGVDAEGIGQPGVMAIVGTMDNDQIPERTYELYDKAGTEESVLGGLFKSMKLIEGGTHAGFSAQVGGDVAQRNVTKGYVLAFMAEHLMGDTTWYESYVRGDMVPIGWDTKKVVISQLHDVWLAVAIFVLAERHHAATAMETARSHKILSNKKPRDVQDMDWFKDFARGTLEGKVEAVNR